MNKNFKNTISSYRHYFLIRVAFLFLLLSGQAFAGSLSLAWDASTSPNVGGYKIYYGTASKTYSANVDAGNVTSYEITGLTEGKTYYLALKAYDTTHTLESGFSTEVSALVPVTVALTADFNANTVSGTAPLAVSFTPVTTGTVTGLSWNFGDTAIPASTSQNPTVTYSTPGTYTVSLTATGSSGSVTKTKTGYITVSAPVVLPPVADFTVSATSGLAPFTVQFSDTSTGSITGRTWNFGDGASSSARNPSHTYTNPGVYTVDLTVSGPDGNDTKTSAGLITVSAPVGDTTKGLIAAYNFEELNRWIIADASGLGNHGWIKEGVRNPSGRFGNALELDGVDDWVTVPDSDSLDISNSFTLEIWVKPLSTSTQSVIYKEYAKGSVYSLYAAEGGDLPMSSLNDGQADRVISGSSVLPVNQWSHLTSTYDGAVQKLYVDGVLISERAQTGLIRSSKGVLRIGGNKLWGDYFHGFIDEVRVYNRALTQAEIAGDINTSIASTKPKILVLGNGTVETAVNTNPEGTAEAFKTTAAKDGVITAMKLYLDAGSSATEVVTGIYEDNLGHPGNLLGQVKFSPDKSGLWVQIPLPSVKVAAGQSYWIAVLSTNGDIKFRNRFGSGSAPLETSSQTNLVNLPNTWVTGTVYPNDGPISINGIGY